MKMMSNHGRPAWKKIICLVMCQAFVLTNLAPQNYGETRLTTRSLEATTLAPTLSISRSEFEKIVSLPDTKQPDRETIDDAVSFIGQALLGTAPQTLRDNIAAGVITDRRQLEMAKLLLELKQHHLFAGWPEAGADDAKKQIFLEGAYERNSEYPGGLSAYQENARVELDKSKRGVNPFTGATPEVPDGVQIRTIKDVVEGQDKGIRLVNKTAFVFVAGGTGDRLGYEGIKMSIPLSAIAMRDYLQEYIDTILAWQEKANSLNKTDDQIPVVIMTSNDTHQATLELLASKGYTVEYRQGKMIGYWVLSNGLHEISIVKQGAVPAMINNNGDFTLSDDNPFELASKPHGHGDVNMLMYQSGLVNDWVAKGITNTVFLQDTNGQVMNAILTGLSVSQEKGLDFNFLTVPREAGEAAGAITRLVKTDGSSKNGNVEYNQIDSLLKAEVRNKTVKLLARDGIRGDDVPGVIDAIVSFSKGEDAHGVLNHLLTLQKTTSVGNDRYAGDLGPLNLLLTISEKIAEASNLPEQWFAKAKATATSNISKIASSTQLDLDKMTAVLDYISHKRVNGDPELYYIPDVSPIEFLVAGAIWVAAIHKLSGDIPDQQTGNSPFPGNLNVFIVDTNAYQVTLNRTEGVIGEFINPKYADEAKTKFQKPTRLESMMQDLAFEMKIVGVTNFHDKRLIFSPVKNNLKDAASKSKAGNASDSMPAGEADYYRAGRIVLKDAGVDINVEGEAQEVLGVRFMAGAKIILDPRFAPTIQDAKQKISRKGPHTVSAESTLWVEGSEMFWDGSVSLAGALHVVSSPGRVALSNVDITNADYELVAMDESGLKHVETAPYLKVRGYSYRAREEAGIASIGTGSIFVEGGTLQGNVLIISEFDGEVNVLEGRFIDTGVDRALLERTGIINNKLITIDRQGKIVVKDYGDTNQADVYLRYAARNVMKQLQEQYVKLRAAVNAIDDPDVAPGTKKKIAQQLSWASGRIMRIINNERLPSALINSINSLQFLEDKRVLGFDLPAALHAINYYAKEIITSPEERVENKKNIELKMAVIADTLEALRNISDGSEKIVLQESAGLPVIDFSATSQRTILSAI